MAHHADSPAINLRRDLLDGPLDQAADYALRKSRGGSVFSGLADPCVHLADLGKILATTRSMDALANVADTRATNFCQDLLDSPLDEALYELARLDDNRAVNLHQGLPDNAPDEAVTHILLISAASPAWETRRRSWS